MIVVLASIDIKAGYMEQGLTIASEHVARSRTETGCISHDVHIHAENKQQLVFVERWTSLEDLKTHFNVAGSQQFLQDIKTVAASEPVIEILQADTVQF